MIFVCNGILFNHESPIRGETFVTKKIIQGLVKIKKVIKKLFLGNLYSKEIGATQRTMWRPCGKCYNKKDLMIM